MILQRLPYGQNIGVELNLLVGEINSVLLHFILKHLILALINSSQLHSSNFEYHVFEWLSFHKFIRSNKCISYKGTLCRTLCKPKIDVVIHHHDNSKRHFLHSTSKQYCLELLHKLPLSDYMPVLLILHWIIEP